MTNDQYIHGLKTGDQTIIQKIYETNLGKLTSWIRKNNGSEDDALDLFQEGIEAIIKKIYQGKLPEKLNFDAYLFTICKNKWLDKLKDKKREHEVRNQELNRYDNEYQDDIAMDEDDRDTQMKRMLDDTFELLSETCQQVLSLLESGLSPAEVAEEMQMSNANTVYRRKFACYDSWKKHVMTHPYYKVWKT